jgi:yecA family protein
VGDEDDDFCTGECFNSTAESEERPVTPQPLSDAELERMHDILERFGDKRAMNLEQLDGFLAALLCGPDEVPQSEYLREIWGERNEDAFTAQPILQDFAYLITRHRDAIAHTLQSGDVFTPLLLADEHGVSRGNIGQVVSCVEWSCATKIGLPS